METIRSSKTLVSYHIPTRGHNPEDHNMNHHHRENLNLANPTMRTRVNGKRTYVLDMNSVTSSGGT
jgi:hypothetical protein